MTPNPRPQRPRLAALALDGGRFEGACSYRLSPGGR